MAKDESAASATPGKAFSGLVRMASAVAESLAAWVAGRQGEFASISCATVLLKPRAAIDRRAEWAQQTPAFVLSLH